MLPSNPSSDHENLPQAQYATEELTLGIEKEIEALHQLSAIKRLKEVSLFIGLYVTGALLISAFNENIATKCLAIILMGLALNSFGILIHEGLHGLLSQNKFTNHFFSFICGLPLLISAKAYQVTHTNHHFELGRKLDYGTYKQHLGNKKLVWFAYFSQLLLGGVLYIIFIPILALKSASTAGRMLIAAEYITIAALFTSMVQYFSLDSLLHYWLYPSIILIILSNIRGLASHALGNLDDPYISSRTIKASYLTRILFLHENYHLEHHLFPQIPSYHLRNTHELIWNRLPKALYSESYSAFLFNFFKSALTFDVKPNGLVYPAKELKNN